VSKNAATCRPSGAVFLIETPDEAGRVVAYHVQIEAKGVTVWTDDAFGGRLTPPELFAACVRAEAAR
jgi:hypothetical protein